MDTIIIKPKNGRQAEEILNFLRKMDVPAEVYPVPNKNEVLDGIERGAKEVVRHLNGEIQLKDARQLLNEL